MMKLKWIVVAVLLSFSMPVFAGACWVNGEKVGSCQGSDCCGDGTWVPGDGDLWQEQDQSQSQSQYQDQFQIAEGGNAYAEGGNASAFSGSYSEGGNATISEGAVTVNAGDTTVNAGDVSVTTGDVTNTNTNTNNVDVSNVAEGGAGGDGGDATASAVVAEGAVDNDVNVNVNAGTTYHQVRQAPSIAQGSFAISGCNVAGNAGGSNQHGAAFLGIGWTPRECYKFMLAQAYQSIGQYKAVCDILRNTKTGKRLERDGVELPECLPEIVVVPAPVDLSEYATKEELNRAFQKSMEK